MRAIVVSPNGVAIACVDPADVDERAMPTVWWGSPAAAAEQVAEIERTEGPRWAMWSQDSARELLELGVEVARSWDVAAVHRVLFGGWRADPARAWARIGGLSTRDLPADAPLDLFHQEPDGDPDDPVRPDGHLRPDWVAGAWQETPERAGRWATVLAELVRRQRAAIEELADREDGRPAARRTASSESTAELLCAELGHAGLPVDRTAMEAAIASFVGPRPASEREAVERVVARDEAVLRHVPQGIRFDLRSPTQVRSMLRVVGVEVPDTRAWRLEQHRDAHPLVDALLTWRKAERVATTFGYPWLDERLGADGRFRGEWSAADGAAGRMTASGGLHNMPADLRSGVVAAPGHRFVRADLGQIEPRVLAAVSGDRSLARASQADDLYAPVAAELGVERAVAKVAVLGAMYGQTTGEGARALQGLRRSYPIAMSYLEAADATAQVGTDLRTYGGRLLRMGGPVPVERAQAAARGRFGRNAMVQGAAAELFKVWALIVRARGRSVDAEVVLCLHDELLVHVPDEHVEVAASMVDEALGEAAARWAPDRSVRFLSDTSIVRSWADAKP
ncbi:MAG: hypothetical protein KDB04_11705 [Acidimicrobiales bacterium]|nr:hypothetical protein [Acidimicrobiales bacterium]MCB1039187.1 hypothetical protein [Acidimicrobiales bacterium]